MTTILACALVAGFLVAFAACLGCVAGTVYFGARSLLNRAPLDAVKSLLLFALLVALLALILTGGRALDDLARVHHYAY